MPPRRNKLRSNRPAGHLLLLGCSDRKRAVKGKLPAVDLYDGVNFRVLCAFLHKRGWLPGLCIKILSACDLRWNCAAAAKFNRQYPMLYP